MLKNSIMQEELLIYSKYITSIDLGVKDLVIISDEIKYKVKEIIEKGKIIYQNILQIVL